MLSSSPPRSTIHASPALPRPTDRRQRQETVKHEGHWALGIRAAG